MTLTTKELDIAKTEAELDKKVQKALNKIIKQVHSQGNSYSLYPSIRDFNDELCHIPKNTVIRGVAKYLDANPDINTELAILISYLLERAVG